MMARALAAHAEGPAAGHLRGLAGHRRAVGGRRGAAAQPARGDRARVPDRRRLDGGRVATLARSDAARCSSALIVFFILSTNESWLVVAWTSCFAILSKRILRGAARAHLQSGRAGAAVGADRVRQRRKLVGRRWPTCRGSGSRCCWSSAHVPDRPAEQVPARADLPGHLLRLLHAGRRWATRAAWPRCSASRSCRRRCSWRSSC